MNMRDWFGEAPQIVIKTPATSANMGPGFDCLLIAVNAIVHLAVAKNMHRLMRHDDSQLLCIVANQVAIAVEKWS